MPIDWNSIIENVGKSMIASGATLTAQSYLEARNAEKASNAVEKASKLEKAKLMAALIGVGVLTVLIASRIGGRAKGGRKTAKA